MSGSFNVFAMERNALLNNSTSTQYSDKIENVFMKVEPVRSVKVGGSEAQVVFIKHKKTRSEDKTSLMEKPKNDFVSDGGLKERSMKYYNSTTFNKTNAPPKKSSSLGTKVDPNSVQQITSYNVTVKDNMNTQRSESANQTEENKSNSGVRILFNSSGNKKSEIKVVNNFVRRDSDEEKKVAKKSASIGNKSEFKMKGRATSADVKKRSTVKAEQRYDNQEESADIEKVKSLKAQPKDKASKESKENKDQKMKNYNKSLKINNFVKKEKDLPNTSNNQVSSSSNNVNIVNKDYNSNQTTKSNKFESEPKVFEKKVEKNEKVKKTENYNKDSEREDRPKKNSFLKEDKKPLNKISANNNQNQSNQTTQNYNSNKDLNLADKAALDSNSSAINPNNPQERRFNFKPKLRKLPSTDSNKSKPKRTSSSKEKELKILSPEEKIELMEKLIKNKEDEIIKDVQKEVIQKGKQANKKIEKKLKILGERNMLENIQMEIENEFAEKGEIGEMTNSHQEESNNIIKQQSQKQSRRNYFSSSSHNRSKSTPSIQKRTLKPQVNTLEFYAQILQERRNIIGSSSNYQQNYSEMRTEEREKSGNLNNSFRKSASEDKSKRSMEVDPFESNYLFASKVNKRNKQEIHEFIMRKKNEEKEKAIKLENEINEKNLKRLIELTKVYENQMKKSTEPVRRSHSQSRKDSSNYNSESNKFRSSSQKIKNEMFVGRHKLNKSQLDDSSFIDPDEYYLNLLESKNILTPAFNTMGKQYSKKMTLTNPTYPNEEPSASNKDSLKDLPGFSSASHLSGFTKGSKLNFNKRIDEEEDNEEIVLDDKHVYKSQTKEEFLKFIEQKEKEVTIRTLDSNDLLSLKSNRIENPNLHDNNSGSNPIQPAEEPDYNSNLNTGKFHNNDNDSGNSNPNSNKNQNIESKLKGNKSHQESEGVKEESSIKVRIPTEESIKTKKTKITERDLSKFVGLIKLANKKSVFYSLIEEIKLLMLMQHYELSFNYFDELANVFLSRNVLSAFNTLKENAIIHNYHESFNYFSVPIKRTIFNRLKEHAYEVSEEKGVSEEEAMIYEGILNKLLIFPKRLGFSALKELVMELYLQDENELRELYSKGINCLFNPWKRDAFYTLGKFAFNIVEPSQSERNYERSQNQSQNYSENHSKSHSRNIHPENPDSNTGNNSVIIHHDQSPSPSKMGYYEKEEATHKDKEEINDDIQIDPDKSIGKFDRSNRSLNNNNNVNGSFVSDTSGSFYKMHTFLYESMRSNNSSIVLYPNSLDSPRLHAIHELLKNQKERSRSRISDSAGGQDSKSNRSGQGNVSNISNNIASANDRSQQNKSSNHQSQNNINNQRDSPADLNNQEPESNSQSSSFLNNQRLNRSEDGKILKSKNHMLSRPNNEESEVSFSQDHENISKNDKSKDNSKDISNNMIHDKSEDKGKFNTQIPEKPAIEKTEDSISEEIVEEITHDNYKKQITNTENDISADRDNTSEIDWINTISHSKSSGSYRDVNINNNLNNKNNLSTSNQFLDNDSINKSASNIVINLNNRELNEIKEEKDQEEVSNGVTIENNVNTSNNAPVDNNQKEEENANANRSLKEEINNSHNKSVNNAEIAAKNNNQTITDDGADYNDFVAEDVIDEIIEDKGSIIEEINADKGEDGLAESQSRDNAIHHINKNPGSPSINSIKSRNTEKKKDLNKGKESGNLSLENYVPSEVDLNERDERDQNREVGEHNPADINAPQNKTDTLDYETINDPAVVEKEINLDKVTIESTDIHREGINFTAKDKMSIESADDTGGYFVVKPSNDLKVYNLLDDKSSYNKSSKNENVTSPIYSDRDKQDLVSNVSYNINVSKDKETINNTIEAVTEPPKIPEFTPNNNIDLDAKEKTISFNNQTLSVNKRYDNLLEDSARRTEKSARSEISVSSEFEENLMKADLNILAEELTNYILEDLLHAEIVSSNVPLVPRKSFKSDSLLQINVNNSGSSFTSNNKSKNPMDDSVFMASQGSLNNSIFMKSILEHKKETSLNLYMDKIAPKLVKNIGGEISKKYETIVDKLSTPYTNNPANLVQSLIYRDQNLLKKSYKVLDPSNKTFTDKKAVLSQFEPVNKKIRESDNITSDNYYDNIMNECFVDAAEEVLNKERLYGELGKPLPWSNRTRAVGFKYGKNEVSKKRLENLVEKELNEMANYKMGLIADNHEYLDLVQLNEEREKRLMNNIIKELLETEEIWKNFELEETQVKLEISEMVLEQLLNEVVEILEHVQLSRRRPNLYQHKSIYACEDIPRLSFQNYNTENENDNINQ